MGEGIARRLAGDGANVVLTGRTSERGEKIVTDIKNAGGQAMFVRTDIASEADVNTSVDRTIETYGSLDILVNNAIPTDKMALAHKLPLDIGNKELADVFEVVLYGTLWYSKRAISHMLTVGGGSIINISSLASIRGITGLTAYSSAKGAINALTRTLATEYGRQGIRANTIVSGFIQNEATAPILDIPGAKEALAGLHLTPRLGVPSDIAAAAAFLASDDAEFINGIELVVDGGASIKDSLSGLVDSGLIGAFADFSTVAG
jgi:NAD(P)-dependent dehydrogenase (short-subunit alcohol dehydrogenase family)